jgi:hypothetical protein
MSEKKIQKFTKYEIGTLTAWGYRRTSEKHFRLSSDFMHLFWIIDDRTDEQSSLDTACEIAIIKHVLAYPDYISPDQSVLEKVCQQLVSFPSYFDTVLTFLKVVEEGLGRPPPPYNNQESVST